jgi:hypothetical protein
LVHVLHEQLKVFHENDYHKHKLFSTTKKFSFFFVFKIKLTSILAAKYCSLVSQHKLNGAFVKNESTTGEEAI